MNFVQYFGLLGKITFLLLYHTFMLFTHQPLTSISEQPSDTIQQQQINKEYDRYSIAELAVTTSYSRPRTNSHPRFATSASYTTEIDLVAGIILRWIFRYNYQNEYVTATKISSEKTSQIQ